MGGFSGGLGLGAVVFVAGGAFAGVGCAAFGGDGGWGLAGPGCVSRPGRVALEVGLVLGGHAGGLELGGGLPVLVRCGGLFRGGCLL